MASVVLALASCGNAEVFACSDDSSCPDGRCEPIGYCSFPASDCESGWRYGGFSGPFSGQCVMPMDAATSGSPTEGEGSGPTPGSSSSASTSADSTSTSGVDPSDPSSDDSDDSGPSTMCGAGQACFGIPEGWSGPVNLTAPGEPCASVVAEGALGYDGGWECECSCDASVEDSCEGASVQLELFEDNNCEGPVALAVELTSSCQSFGDGELYSILVTVGGDAPCTSNPVLDPSPVEPVDPRLLCDAFEGSTCDGGVCTSNAVGLCIHAEGELECPDGFERTLLYADYEDARDCSGCECEAPFQCSGSYTLANQGCGESGSLTLQAGCTGFLTSVLGGEAASIEGPPSVDCSTRGGFPVGELAPTEPRTVCCTP